MDSKDGSIRPDQWVRINAPGNPFHRFIGRVTGIKVGFACIALRGTFGQTAIIPVTCLRSLEVKR